METFITANRGLAAAFMINGQQPLGTTTNDNGKPALEFEKTAALKELHKSWRDKELVGNLSDYSEAMYKVYLEMKGATNAR